jgi:hypothetical protein
MVRFRRLREFSIVCALVGFGTVAAVAAGMFPGLPIVGGATYDTGSGVMAPAGPTVVTGNELVPADTQLSGGRAPQTVLLPMSALHALPVNMTTLTAGAATYSFTASATDGGVMFIGPGAISPTTVNFPAAPINQQRFKIGSNNTIATLTLAAGVAKNISNTPTALTVSTTAPYGYEFVYNSATSTWYRLQ